MARAGKTVFAALVCCALAFSAVAQEARFKVIVRSDHPGTALRKETLTGIFLGQAKRWGSGGVIRPVDQSTRSLIRRAFSQEILGRSVDGVKSYWRRQILLGALRPPPVKETDTEVIEFVASKSGAIGYVDADATLPESVKVLTILE